MNTATHRFTAFSPAQSAYLAAVAAHDSAVKGSAAECARRGYIVVAGQSDEDFDAACKGIDRVNLEWNVWNLEHARRIASYEVAEWFVAAGIVGRPLEAKSLTDLLAKVRTMSYLNLRKVVALAMEYRGK